MPERLKYCDVLTIMTEFNLTQAQVTYFKEKIQSPLIQRQYFYTPPLQTKIMGVFWNGLVHLSVESTWFCVVICSCSERLAHEFFLCTFYECRTKHDRNSTTKDGWWNAVVYNISTCNIQYHVKSKYREWSSFARWPKEHLIFAMFTVNDYRRINMKAIQV